MISDSSKRSQRIPYLWQVKANSYWQQQIVNIKAGKEWTPITAWDKDGKPILGQGYSDAEIANAQVVQPQTNQVTLSPTPPDLKGAMVWMDNFLGTINAVIAADVISMKPEALKFRLFGKDYNYSGHYTVMLNTPRQHKNPYFGLGSPETANLVILENVGGDVYPLQNATIWEKSNGFIVVVALNKEWIHSGTYTTQN